MSEQDGQISPSVHILVVDEDKDANWLFEQRFRSKIKDHRYRLTFARQGSEALEALEETKDPIDIVLTDMNVPGIDGLALMESIQHMDIKRKVILVTSYGDTDHIRLAMNQGACDFCIKPIDFEDLDRSIERAFDALLKERFIQSNQDDLKGLQKELAVSSKLQQSILPKEFLEHRAVDLHAEMTAARNVGGDFYDFFWLDRQRLGFAIADVSGKNISAALYMAITRTLLKSMARFNPEPHVCLGKVNQALCQDNEACMFATAFYGILNINTGDLMYSNAGHCPPLWIRKGRVLSVEDRDEPALALGVMEDNPLQLYQISLQAHDRFLLFTDGVTEAFNPENEEFGEERTESSALAHADLPAREWLQKISEDVHVFMDSAPPSDDLTLLALHFKGAAPT